MGLGIRLFGATYFKRKVIAIMGAEHPLGRSLALRFAGFGATVVALGDDEALLFALAQKAADRIEPLALREGRRDIMSLLQEAWGDEPLHIYIDCSPLEAGQPEQDPTRCFTKSAGVAAALMGGLRRGRAQAVLMVPDAGSRATPDDTARKAGYTAMVRQFAKECAPGRFCGLNIAIDTAWTERALMRTGDAVMMLVHPISRAVEPGEVIALAPRIRHQQPSETQTVRKA